MSALVKRLGIVVAVDGSPASDAATCWAARDAAMRNIPLTVVSVVTTPTATYPPVRTPNLWGYGWKTRGATPPPTRSRSPKTPCRPTGRSPSRARSYFRPQLRPWSRYPMRPKS
jgi:nucleotide-binding universal stress UspA family protein